MAEVLADVIYADQKAGVVFWDASRRVGVFEYTPEFVKSGLELSPLRMPLRGRPYQFPNGYESYSGLPGMLADCLPDTYGHALINEWLRRQGREPADFSPVERLCYLGSRGMGALEFRPAMRGRSSKAEKVEVDQLVELASRALSRKEGLAAEFDNEHDLNEILRVGTSAGGARAKAVIAWNRETNEVRSGQAGAPKGFEHWLLKFDGISSAFDGVRDPQGYGRIEYAYHLMARKAGIAMEECRLFEEGGRAHFMTRRFDRYVSEPNGGKVHYASLFGMAHMSYAAPGAHSHSYEDYFKVIEQLDLEPSCKVEAFRRMVFNVLGCNRDDHSKNFGFLMDVAGRWGLSPAFDVTYASNPLPGKWTATQQMSVMGKRERISKVDLIECGRLCSIATRPRVRAVVDEVASALENWQSFALKAKVGDKEQDGIAKAIKVQLDNQ
jgi:serine/threonine-protein kinase HipA